MNIKFYRGMEISESTSISEVIYNDDEVAILKFNHNNYGVVFNEMVKNEAQKISGHLADFIKAKMKPYEDVYILIGRPEYKIYSLVNGPYADNYDEIISFCCAFKRLFSEKQDIEYSNLIYIEEFDVLLPVKSKNLPGIGKEQLLAMWLTDGLKLNKLDLEQLSVISSWMKKESISNAVESAGFKVEDSEKTKSINDSTPKGDSENISQEPFVLPGREILTKYFNEQIIDFIKNMEKYERMGITTVPATLLYGKPGCGKTYAVNKLAEYLHLPVFEINSISVASPYIHDTSKKIGEVFLSAIEAAPSVLIIDEIEAYLSSRDKAGSSNHKIEEVDEFLRNIPKAIEAKVIIFGMTNMLDLIDPAVLRKGRFDSVQEVGMPTKEEIMAVIENGISKIPTEEKIDIAGISEKLRGRQMSDISYIIRQAARLAVKSNCEKVCQDNFDEAILTLEDNKQETKKRIGFL